MPDMPDEPLCRTNSSAADRAVLYGAVLAAQRPGVRLKPAIASAANALVPAVRAFLEGRDDDQAADALAYARACGAEAFLVGKRATHTGS
jgi:hypothetical protein